MTYKVAVFGTTKQSNSVDSRANILAARSLEEPAGVS